MRISPFWEYLVIQATHLDTLKGVGVITPFSIQTRLVPDKPGCRRTGHVIHVGQHTSSKDRINQAHGALQDDLKMIAG